MESWGETELLDRAMHENRPNPRLVICTNEFPFLPKLELGFLSLTPQKSLQTHSLDAMLRYLDLIL